MIENKSEKKIKGMIEYPCGPKETVIVYETSQGSFSSKCPRCGNCRTDTAYVVEERQITGNIRGFRYPYFEKEATE